MRGAGGMPTPPSPLKGKMKLMITQTETGIDVLSIGHGDIHIRFDEKDVLEVERAKRIIEDMIRRGYSLFVHGKGKALVRVQKFDAKKGFYIIAAGALEAEPAQSPELRPRRGRPAKTESVHMGRVKATIVGRSAGG